MQATISLLNVLLQMFYAVATLAYGIAFFRDDPVIRRASRPLLLAVLSLHALYLTLRIARFGHIPLASLSEVLTSIAFAVAALYLCIEYLTRTHRTGIFLLTLSLACQTISSAFITSDTSFPPLLRSPLFALHAGSAVLSYTAFGVSAIYGILFLMLYHHLKDGRFGLIYQRLPSLELLAMMSLRAAIMGFLLLTATIALGALWAAREFPGFWLDPKFFMTSAIWCVYAAGLAMHYALGWGGRRAIYFSLAGFVLLIISVIAGRFWVTTFHGFA